MKPLFSLLAGLVVVCSVEAANAQVAVGFFAPPAVMVAPPMVVAPAVPVVAYYGAPFPPYAPGYYAPGPLLPASPYYRVRQRTFWRGPYYRSTLRVRGW